VSGKLARSRESEELRFFPPGRLPRDASPPARALLKDLAAGRHGMVR
jgi:hypothetical protein